MFSSELMTKTSVSTSEEFDVNFKISICFFIISLNKSPGCSKKGRNKVFWVHFIEVKKIEVKKTYLRRESIFNEPWAIEL